MMKWLTHICIFSALVSAAFSSSKADDVIVDLPGLSEQPLFKQYSGFVSGISDNYQLHYWLVEAQEDAAQKPLVLWMNGGPGCSSMEGFLTENGPFLVQEGKALGMNEQAWNKLANMVFLEAPAGVGFSYAKDKNVTTDDDLTASNNLAALKNILDRFPEYKGRDFYITGESYGGVYVPTLALQVLQDKEIQLELKGIAVGNGLTSYELNDNSLLYFANFHGLIGKKIWEPLMNHCCDDPTKIKCLFTRSTSSICQKLIGQVNNIINSGLDIYNLYSECAGGVNVLWKHWTGLNNGTYELFANEGENTYTHTDMGNLFRSNPYVKRKRAKKLLTRKNLKNLDAHVKLVIPCVDDKVITSYLNDPMVRKAIHVENNEVNWEVCSDLVSAQYVRTYQELSEQYTKIVKSGVRTFLYNGDVDMACNFIGDEWFLDSLGMKMVEERRSWTYMEADNTKQIGGFVKRYGDESKQSLTYVTIRGSGHMAPTDKPRATYHMFEVFMSNARM